MNARIILCNDKKNFVAVNVDDLQEIKCVYRFDAEEVDIQSDFANKFDLNNLYEAKFIGKNNSFVVERDKIVGVEFINE